LVLPAFAQKLDPVQWTLTSETTKAPGGSSVAMKLTATLEKGWHLYSLTQPKGGPITSTASLAEAPAVASSKIYQPGPEKKFDRNFNLETETFGEEVVFWVVADLKKDAPAGPAELVENLRYQACDEKQCLPPKKKTVSFTLAIDGAAPAPPAFVVPAGYQEVKTGAPAASATGSPAAPVAFNATSTPDDLWTFLLSAFGLGLASIFTPCVFPMIPITVSFFIQQKGGLFQALVFAVGIIAFFTGLGLGVTALLGPFGVVQLGSNVWVNAFIALVFGIFAISLLGAFEIALPSGLLTSLDKASRRGGVLGTLIMGLTFSLTSFACVGPFFGSILTASVSSGGSRPAMGMISYAGGLALPFFFLAAFPAYLKKLPRSGGWMLRVKVVMGFVLLAGMLKYVSSIDQVLQWNFLTRERFLAAWFVLFAMAGLYLLGFLRLEGVEAGDHLGIGRLIIASAFLIFAISLLPGMFGGKLGNLDAYVPSAPGADDAWMKNQYRAALARAKSENKPVLVSFTGYACTNCHWMKANLFPRPEIAGALKDFVLVELYTDGTDQLSEENQKVQEQKFQTVAIPFYAIIDADEHVIASFAGKADSPAQFLAFLDKRSPSTVAAR
jgi:thiol:disulfide interchange protein DsbD